MGSPSLLEDIVQKRIDNFLESEIDFGQFYTREEFKRAISQLGINARSFLTVDDDELVEISEEFAKETKRFREENESIRQRSMLAQESIKRLDQSLEEAKAKNDKPEITLSKLTAQKPSAAAKIRDLQDRLSCCQLEKKKIQPELEKSKMRLSAFIGM